MLLGSIATYSESIKDMLYVLSENDIVQLLF